ISRHDREGLRSGLATLRHTLQSLFSELTKDSDRALIENTIERYIGQEILSQLHLLLEVTEQEGYPSFARDLIDTVGKLGEAALEDETTGTVTEAMVNGFLDPFAERNLKPGDEENFTSALRAMTDIGVSAARKQQGRVTIEVIRSLGKTAEVFINTG